MKRSFILFLPLVFWAISAAHGDDYSRLRKWFSKPEDGRGSVPKAVTGTLNSEQAAKKAAENIWRFYQAGAAALGWKDDFPAPLPTLEEMQALPADQRPPTKPGSMTDSGKEMPFFLLAKGERGENGWPLFISMHGGGIGGQNIPPHSSPINDQEWQAQVRLFESIYPPGLYFIPRMADDNDGRWWFHYCQAIYDRAIRRAILFRDVDPNRVYVMGISEGGYAAYRLGAHMADRWAGSCSMAAAEPMDTSPPENFRNLPFRCGIGEQDAMFDRIGLARRYFKKLDELQQADGSPDAYVHFFDEQKGRGHGIDYQPGPLWISQFERNPWPKQVVWTVQPLHDVVRRQQYWLVLDELPERTPLYLNADVEENVVTVTAEVNGDDGQRVPASGVKLRVYLNDQLADLDKPVKVVVNGKTAFNKKVKRRVATLARSLNERGDPYFMFPVEISVATP